MKNLQNRRLSIMGSTGSIGTQTLDIARNFPEQFKVEALTANHNWELLAKQSLEFSPKMAVIADESHYSELKEALKGTPTEVLAGKEALIAAAILPESDMVVAALVGYSGLPSTIAALEAGKTVALANKETLVVGGEIVEKIVGKSKASGQRRHALPAILPVDSEHSAIFQCLQGEEPSSVSKLILTASGGPFRNLSRDQLSRVTVEQALSHPNWHMGAKVTIDSATMMNKGFEMIEARWLFGMQPEDIEVVVHPESIVHSLVEFIDGSVKAQMSLPDMHLPIAVALGYPHRLPLSGSSCPGPGTLNLPALGKLTFEQPDMLRFPLLGLAYSAAEAGGLVPALMNAANETAVKAFLDRKIGFADISQVVMASVKAARGIFRDEEVSLESIASAHKEGTKIALDIIERKTRQ